MTMTTLLPDAHRGHMSGEWRVIRWDCTGPTPKREHTEHFGLSKREADRACMTLAATSTEGIVYSVHGAGALVPPKVGKSPKTKVLAIGRNRADLRGLSLEEAADYLYPSTDFAYMRGGKTIKVSSPVEGNEYIIDEMGDCSCEAGMHRRRCRHKVQLVMKLKNGDVRPFEED